MYEKGEIYLSSYTGQYSIGEEMFVEGPPGTIGPDGKPTETVTEENFFFRLSDYQGKLLDLIESNELRITPDSSRNEVLSFLRGADADNPAVAAERGTTALGKPYIVGALRDLSVSRSSFTWGIPVPEPAASETTQKHVIYVWLDALANYMTALGYGSDDTTLYDKYWPADLHLVGKEITRFHCVYWPAFLMAAGLPVPRAVTANGWLLFDNAKMSKSKGNVVRTETILNAFGNLVYAVPFPTSTHHEQDLFGADVLRYFLLREIPFGQDGNFSLYALETTYNADLANGYGNLVSRTLKPVVAGRGGVIPAMKAAANDPLFLAETDNHTSRLMSLSQGFQADLEALSFASALSKAKVMVTLTDGYITQYAPWKLVGSDDPSLQDKAATILYTAAESIRIITACLYPIIPFAAAKGWAQLGLGDIEEAARKGELRELKWRDAAAPLRTEQNAGVLRYAQKDESFADNERFYGGFKLGPLAPIFPRAPKGLAQIMVDMESPTTSAAPPEPAQFDPAAGPRTTMLAEPNPGARVAGSTALTTERPPSPHHSEAQASGSFAGEAAAASLPTDGSPEITIDDFAKVELRVAQIVVAERIPKADKLLRLEVDLGYEKRQILSGIAEWYTPEDLIGRRIVVITNLAPRKMRGLESHGMLLAASTEGGKPALATFEAADSLPLGSRLK